MAMSQRTHQAGNAYTRGHRPHKTAACPTRYELVRPRTKRKEEDEALVFLVHVPGFLESETRFTKDEPRRFVRVYGERKITNFLGKRFDTGFTIPENCNFSELKSKFDNGIIKIRVPKLGTNEEPGPGYEVITIKVSAAHQETSGHQEPRGGGDISATAEVNPGQPVLSAGKQTGEKAVGQGGIGNGGEQKVAEKKESRIEAEKPEKVSANTLLGEEGTEDHQTKGPMKSESSVQPKEESEKRNDHQKTAGDGDSKQKPKEDTAKKLAVSIGPTQMENASVSGEKVVKGEQRQLLVNMVVAASVIVGLVAYMLWMLRSCSSGKA